WPARGGRAPAFHREGRAFLRLSHLLPRRRRRRVRAWRERRAQGCDAADGVRGRRPVAVQLLNGAPAVAGLSEADDGSRTRDLRLGKGRLDATFPLLIRFSSGLDLALGDQNCLVGSWGTRFWRRFRNHGTE